MRYALLIAYDGTSYGGWQIQKNKITVQQRLEEAVQSALGCRAAVTASGRTDSGVHAAGQVCHLDAQTSIPPERLADALNAHLPCDISVLRSVAAPAGFDACRSARKKTYCYRVYVSPRRNPLKDRYSHWLKDGVDVAKLRDIAGCFVGEHDFKAYCKSRSSAKTTVREVYAVEVAESYSRFGRDIEIYVTGAGFLYNMVRTMAGTMLYYAAGVLDRDGVVRSLAEGRRELVGKTMPAAGLTLESVDYGFCLFG